MADEPQGQREQQARYLTYTERFLWSAVQRGELHQRSYELMLTRVNRGLMDLGYAPLPSRVAAPAEAPSAPVAAGGAPMTPTARTTPTPGPAAVRRPEPLTGRQLGMTWLLYLGAFFLFLAAVTFTAFGWQEFSDVLKFFIVAAYTLGLFGVSVLARRFDLPQAEATFFWLGTATVPISVGAFVAFVLGVPMDTTFDRGEWWEPRWLALELLGTGLLFLALDRWRGNLGLRIAGLGAIALAPLAQLATAEQLAPVAAAGITLAYVLAAGLVPKGGWKEAMRWTALAIGALALLIAGVSGALRFFDEMEIVHAARSGVENEVSAAIAFAMLTVSAYLARRQGWWSSRLPEAALAGFTATALITSFGLGGLGDAARLLYLAALVVPAAYAVLGRPWETLASSAAPLVAIVLLSRPETVARAAAPTAGFEETFVAGDLLVPLAATIACALAAVAVYRGGRTPERATVMQVGAVASVILLAAWLAVIPMTVPWSSAALTLLGCAFLVAAARDELATWLPAAGAALGVGLVGIVSYQLFYATSWPDVADPFVEPAWWLAAYFALTAATVLALRYLAEWGRKLSAIFVGLSWLAVFFAYTAIEQDPFVFLAVAAVVAYAASFVYEEDAYRPVGTLLGSLAVLAYVDMLVDDLDDGIVLLLLTPAFVHAAVAWWDAKDPLRQGARSLSLVVIPVLVLGAGAATSYGDDVTTFLYIVLLGSAFAVAGFAQRVAGFAGVGLLFVLFASIRFVAPYISYIPAWVGFGLAGVILLAAYFVWVRLRGRSIGESIPTTGWR